ncbi:MULTISPECIES: hypothetical protein [unclassified Pseudomonas]|uniref:hypothetical protein n=1 Tax=unclassified Pseudomonas TaxID=196821 RepID=UPI00244CF90A|nr:MULTISPECIES: hypothetical protein [unclassified Pseudomonas]MDH0301837.1 hypothetical protein [Pseudomonas sp. GD04091]MDH1983875.1 hypothetical protein [Pseudomonas sp. GD03689]
MSASLALACLFGSQAASAWVMVNGVPMFKPAEIRHCELVAMDAIDIMASRQFNEPIAEDVGTQPSQLREDYKVLFAEKAKSYPVGATQEEKHEALRQFLALARLTCREDYKNSVPPTEIR